MKKIILILLIFVAGCAPRISSKTSQLNRLDPVSLRIFLAEMPKGAELHTHLSGIPYAEDYLNWAAEDGACVEPASARLVPAPCSDGAVPVSDVYENNELWSAALNKLSTRQGRRDNALWGHDQFFATFDKFGAAKKDKARLLAHAAKQAERDKVQYLEVMISIYSPKWVTPWADMVGWNGNAKDCLELLKDAGLFDVMTDSRQWLDKIENRKKDLLANGPGSRVNVKYINQIFRGAEPKYVFAQMAWSFELAHRDPRVVGVNMVGPEDAPIAIRDYELHMEMIDFFHQLYPDVPITLHAGELTRRLASPEALSNHIRLAVEKGHARRIGHGVALEYEENATELLELMHSRNVVLETLLGSNDIILHVGGDRHPLRKYLKAGVPVVISSDDMGVARSTLIDEYRRAVEEQGFNYTGLKQAARNSIEYSFLPGKSLWTNGTGSTMVSVCSGSKGLNVDCANYLEGNEKANEQWKLEELLRSFENSKVFKRARERSVDRYHK